MDVRHQRQERRGERFDADYPNKILRERLGQHIETPRDVLTIHRNVLWRAGMADETHDVTTEDVVEHFPCFCIDAGVASLRENATRNPARGLDHFVFHVIRKPLDDPEGTGVE